MSVLNELKKWLENEMHKAALAVKNSQFDYEGILTNIAKDRAYSKTLIKIEELEAKEQKHERN